MEEPVHTLKLSDPPNQGDCIQIAIWNGPWPVSPSELCLETLQQLNSAED